MKRRLFALLLASACEPPTSTVILDNGFAPSGPVIYQAYWEAVTFSTPVAPGTSSQPETTVSASATTAYVVLAPGWNPASGAQPTSFVLLQSSGGFALHLGDTLHIPVSDETFDGDCSVGSELTQTQADFMTTIVFPGLFAGGHYDAATCTMTLPPQDAGSD
jgi:hypothetical protein